MAFRKNKREDTSDSSRESGTAPSSGEFLRDLLATYCLLAGADEGAILRKNPVKGIDVLYLHPSQGTGKTEQGAVPPQWLVQAASYIDEALLSRGIIARPLKGSKKSGNLYILLVSLALPDITPCVAAFLVRLKGEREIEECGKRLHLAMRLAELSRHGLERHEESEENLARLKQAMEVLSAMNREDKFFPALMAFCNEMASQWRCERVSIGFLKGKYIRMEAMSHTEDFNRKTRLVQELETVMEECMDQDMEILVPAPQGSTYVHRVTEDFARRHGPVNILSLPLRRKGKVIGVVSMERPIDRPFTLKEIETIRLACELGTPRLADLHLYGRWIGATIAARCGDFMTDLAGPKHTWAKAGAVGAFLLILFLIFGKGEFRISAPFTFEPVHQQVITAPFDGYIKDVNVEVNDFVEGNKTLLASLDTAELRLQLAAARAERARYLKQASIAMRDNKIAQAQMARAEADKIGARIDLLNYQISRARIISPINGIVVKGDMKKKIGAPVKTGDVLFEVSPLESLRAEIMIPEEEIFYVKTGQKGHLATASYPSEDIEFVVERINPMAEVVNQRNVFRVRARLLDTYPWIRPGMEGVAKVSAGRRSYVWIWTRKIINWIRMKLWI